MENQRKIEHRALWRLKFLANCIEFQLESEELGEHYKFAHEFRAKQIEDLQKTLSVLKETWAVSRPLPPEGSTL